MTPRTGRTAKKAAKAPKAGGYRQLLRWAALPVTDRRWAAPLSALALGFGLFVGVAIGPGASGTFATSAAQLIEIPEVPGFIGGTGAEGEEDEGGGSSSNATGPAGGASEGGGGAMSVSESPLPSLVPIESSESEEGGTTESSGPKPAKETPPPAEEQPEVEKEMLAGIVLHVNPAAGSYAVVESGGTLSAVHAAKVPKPGMKVSVPTRLLANGTFAEAGPRKKLAMKARAAFNGVVTYVDPTPSAPAYTVSKRGVSVLVRVHPDPTGAAPVLPALGAFANVEVDIETLQPPASTASLTAAPDEPPVSAPVATAPSEEAQATAPPADPVLAAQTACATDPSQPPLPVFEPEAILWQRQVSAEGAPFTYGDFAGIVEAICVDSGELLISADDTRQGLRDILFSVPPGIAVKKLKVGESVLATATIGADGSLSLTGLASDERAKGAEDLKAAQGDLAPSKLK